MEYCFSSQGEIGCYLSHLQILKDFVLSKQKYCLIFEDDIHLEKNFKIDLREALQECPEDWDLLYLYAKKNIFSKHLGFGTKLPPQVLSI